jgi:hypothetical protein
MVLKSIKNKDQDSQTGRGAARNASTDMIAVHATI